MKKIILAMPLVLACLGGGALAQEATTTTDSGAALGAQWSDAIKQGLFSDSEMTTLRPEADVTKALSDLSDADRSTMVDDCRAMERADPNAAVPANHDAFVQLCAMVAPK